VVLSLQMKARLDFFYILMFSLVHSVIFYSVIYPEFYVNGDNEYYRAAYNALSGLDFGESLRQFSSLGGSGKEPVTIAVFFAASKFLDFSTFQHLINVLFVFSIGCLLRQKFRHWRIIFFLVAVSFYVFIVGGLTKRLAISLSFLSFSLCFIGGRYRYFLAFLSLLSHFQSLIVFSASFISFLSLNFRRLSKYKGVLILCFVLFCLFCVFYYDFLYGKLVFYISYTGFDFFGGMTVFFWPVILAVINRRISASQIMFFLVLFVFSFIVGVGRINLLGFFAVLYFCRGSKEAILFLIILLPFSCYKHLDFHERHYKPGVIFENNKILGE
jgi:hypothetical protein